MPILSVVDADKLCPIFNFPLLGNMTGFPFTERGKQPRCASFLLPVCPTSASWVHDQQSLGQHSTNLGNSVRKNQTYPVVAFHQAVVFSVFHSPLRIPSSYVDAPGVARKRREGREWFEKCISDRIHSPCAWVRPED